MTRPGARRPEAGWRGERAPLFAFLVAAAGAMVLGGWGREAHRIVTTEAGRLLPPPLSDYFREHADELGRQSNEPDRRVARLRSEVRRIERDLAGRGEPDAAEREALQAARRTWRVARARHFFDVDALTDEPPPLESFPRDREAARRYVAEFLMRTDRARAAELLGVATGALPEELSREQADRLGEAVLLEHGTLPWTIRDAVDELAETFRERRVEHLPRVIGRLSHYVGDLHQPLHTTVNYDGRRTGNRGVHAVFEVHIVNRYRDAYRELPAEFLSPYDFEDDVLGMVFEQLAENAGRTKALLAADSRARKEGALTEEDVRWVKGRGHDENDRMFLRRDLSELEPREARLVRHADRLHALLRDRHDDLVGRCLGDAASSVASLVYTAWVEAGQPPLTAGPPPGKAKDEAPPAWQPYVPFLVVAAFVVFVLVARRLREPPRSDR